VTDLPLRGFGAVVVGGSRGIGAAVAALLAQLGAGVVVNGRDVDAVASTVGAIASAGGNAVGLPGSAAEDAVAHAVISLCEKEFGQINALVNCAGTAEPSESSILTISRQEFQDLIDAHLGTVFATCRAAAPRMVAHGGGSIVNTSSFAFLGDYGGTGYPAGKGAVNGFTMAIAAELGEHCGVGERAREESRAHRRKGHDEDARGGHAAGARRGSIFNHGGRNTRPGTACRQATASG
jgi:NAD(P)-dependent dehydrogenase (short-subunit alcohol dehydrogenase family)